jgi:hypothetical protein
MAGFDDATAAAQHAVPIALVIIASDVLDTDAVIKEP